MSDEAAPKKVEYLKTEIMRLRKALNELTPPLSAPLKRRGFMIYSREPSDDLLVPSDINRDSYYEMLKKYSFRLFLRDVIKNQPTFTPAQVTRYATREVTAGYIAYMTDIGLVVNAGAAYRLALGPIRSFGETLEWSMAEVLKREFFTEAIWGVKMKRPSIGGDYDLLAKIDGSVLYMEIKSSPPRQIYKEEMAAFLDRVCDLRPEIAVFFDDTELRMKDKIVPMFEEAVRGRAQSKAEAVRIEKELFEIECEGRRIFIINAKDSIAGNIGRVFQRHFMGG